MKWKPKGFCQTRLHVKVLMLADTGCRISEANELQWLEVDFDNLLLKLHGKGAKDRLIPFSFELRRHLWRLEQLSPVERLFHRTDRKSTRLNSIHRCISYAVFCLKKKK